jgi:hypothetical protein
MSGTRSRKSWDKIEHRFPQPPAPPGVDRADFERATAIHTHISGTLMKTLDSIDRIRGDATLSAEGQRLKIAALGEAALAALAELDSSDRPGIGVSAHFLAQHAGQAEAAAQSALVPAADRQPLLVALMARLASLPREAQTRAIAEATATLGQEPGNQHARDTLAALQLAPQWAVATPADMRAEAVTALRAALAPQQHAAAIGLSDLMQHTQQLRDGALAELAERGIGSASQMRGTYSDGGGGEHVILDQAPPAMAAAAE